MPKKKAAIADVGAEIASVIDQQASKEMGMPIKDGEIVEPENKVEEPAKEEPKKEEDIITNFDPDKFAEQTAEKVRERLAEEDRKKEEAKSKEAQKSKEEEELIPIFKREGRNPKNYEEIVAESNRIAELKFTRLLEQREAQAQAKEEEKAKAREAELAKSKQFEADFNKMIDEEVTELYQNNKLPKVVDEKDANDVGVKARFELFKTMKEVNEKRVAEGKPPITSISRIFNNYYKPPTTQPAGADAPVSAGRGVVNEDKDEVMPYHKLHKTSFLDLFRVKR